MYNMIDRCYTMAKFYYFFGISIFIFLELVNMLNLDEMPR